MSVNKVLIVDDIFTNRLLVSEILKEIGYPYGEAKNGKQAIEMLSTERFDIVLMDIEMPVMNGIETTKYIREKFEYPLNCIPVLALTAHNPHLFFSDFKDVGFDQLITKPYSINKIKDSIDSAIACSRKTV
ncbi:MAG: response regulator [Bacteroidota bacterium]